uniref:Si:ch1073-67j19.2 n=1 Tax=Sinocyclocheilus rhinocerous TaxID=307959 RepID=A0A673NM44_9TELE
MKTVAFLYFCFLYFSKSLEMKSVVDVYEFLITLPDDLKDFFKGRYSSYRFDLTLKLYFFEGEPKYFSNIPPTNAYYTWNRVGNMGGHPEKHYKALLNKYLNTSEKVAKANARPILCTDAK